MPWDDTSAGAAVDDSEDDDSDPSNYFSLPKLLPGLKDLLPPAGVPDNPAAKYSPEVERLRPWALSQTSNPADAETWLQGAQTDLDQQAQNKARIKAADDFTSQQELEAQGPNATAGVRPADTANDARIASNAAADAEAASEAGRHSNNPLTLATGAMAGAEKITRIPKITDFIQQKVQPAVSSAIDTGLNAAAVAAPALKGIPIIGPLASVNQNASAAQRKAAADYAASQIPATGLDIAATLPVGELAGAGGAVRDIAERVGESAAGQAAREAITGGEEGVFRAVNPGNVNKADTIRARNAYLGSAAPEASGVKLREAAPVSEEMQAVGEGLQLDPAAVGIASKEDLASQIAQLRSNPKGKTAELGRFEAQQEALAAMEGHDAPAAFNQIGDTYSSLHGTTPQLRGRIEELGRIHNALLDSEQIDRFNYKALKDAPEGATFDPVTREIQHPDVPTPIRPDVSVPGAAQAPVADVAALQQKLRFLERAAPKITDTDGSQRLAAQIADVKTQLTGHGVDVHATAPKAPVKAPEVDPQTGEQIYYHGTAHPIDGGQFKPDTFLTPSRDDALTIARAESRLTGGTPQVVEVRAQPDAVHPMRETESFAASNGAVQISNPDGVRIVDTAAHTAPSPIRPGVEVPPPESTIPGLAESVAPEGLRAIQDRAAATRSGASIDRPHESITPSPDEVLQQQKAALAAANTPEELQAASEKIRSQPTPIARTPPAVRDAAADPMAAPEPGVNPPGGAGGHVTQPDGSVVQATPEAIQAGVKRVLARAVPPAINVDPSDPSKLLDAIVDAVHGAATKGGKPLFDGVAREDVQSAIADMGDQFELAPGRTGPGARHPQLRVQMKSTTASAISEAETAFRNGPEGLPHDVAEHVPAEPVGVSNRVELPVGADRNATQARGLLDAPLPPARGLDAGAGGEEPPLPPGRNVRQGDLGGDWSPKDQTPVWRKTARALQDVVGFLPRALGTAFDYSYPFRQGGLLIRNMKDFAPNFVDGLHAMGSEDYARARQAAIEAAPYNPRTLDLTSFEPGAKLGQREEDFMSKLANMIPGFKQSQRAATVFTNGLRSDLANRVAQSWIRNAGATSLKDFPPDKLAQFTKDLDTYGNYINRATGRGNLGAFESSVGALNTVFYGARRNVAMVQVPGYLFNRSAAVRKEAMLDMVGFVGTGMATLKLAQLAGADVGVDPSSADFGKIKVGSTRVDIWGGYQQMARVIYKIGAGQIANPGNSTDTANAVLGFLRNKLSPVASTITNVAEGKNAIGQKVSLKDIPSQFVPLGIQGLVQAIQHDGAVGGLMGLSGLLGTGTQTYQSIGDVRDQATRSLGLPNADPTKPGNATSYADLTPANQRRVDAQDSVTKFQAQNPSDYQTAKAAAMGPIAAKEQQAESAFKSGDLTQPIADIWHDLGIEKRAKQEQLTADYIKSSSFTGNPNVFKQDITNYYNLTSDNTDSTINWEETQAKQLAFVKTLPPSRQAAVQDFLAAGKEQDTPLHQQYSDYIAAKDAAGFYKPGITAAERSTLERKNPQLDAMGAYFSSGQKDQKPSALQSAAAVSLALKEDPSKQYHLQGMTTAVNATAGTQQAFTTYGKRASDYLSGALVERNQDSYAQNLYGKKYASLTQAQQTSVSTRIKDAAIKSAPDLEAYLAWMGERGTISQAAEPYLQALRQKYGKETVDQPIRLQ